MANINIRMCREKVSERWEQIGLKNYVDTHCILVVSFIMLTSLHAANVINYVDCFVV